MRLLAVQLLGIVPGTLQRQSSVKQLLLFGVIDCFELLELLRSDDVYIFQAGPASSPNALSRQYKLFRGICDRINIQSFGDLNVIVSVFFILPSFR